jgi:hypothetical protein
LVLIAIKNLNLKKGKEGRRERKKRKEGKKKQGKEGGREEGKEGGSQAYRSSKHNKTTIWNLQCEAGRPGPLLDEEPCRGAQVLLQPQGKFAHCPPSPPAEWPECHLQQQPPGGEVRLCCEASTVHHLAPGLCQFPSALPKGVTQLPPLPGGQLTAVSPHTSVFTSEDLSNAS